MVTEHQATEHQPTEHQPGERLSAEKPAPAPMVKLLVEMGPLVAFFIANAKFDIFVATGVLMVALIASLVASWRLERKLPIMPLVTAVFALVFGGLTLILRDELFIKLKPTIVNLLFATALFVGLAVGRPLLKVLLGEALQLDELGWRKLTFRWALFFVLLAAINEVVWRTFTNDTWVTFKVFGIMPLTIAFTLTQLPLIKRHMLESPVPARGSE